MALLRKLFEIKFNDCKKAKEAQAIGKEIPHDLFEKDCREKIIRHLESRRDSVKDSKNHMAFYSNLTSLINEYTESSNGNDDQYPVRLKTIEQKFLEANFKGVELKKTELWAIGNGYITKDGKWDKKSIDLAAFIQVLIDLQVLADFKPRKDIDEYFL